MTWTVELTAGLAAYLADAGVGVWRESGAYAPGETAITYGGPPQAPDRVVAITPYPVLDDAGLADVVQGMQVRCRGVPGDTSDVDALADAVYEAIHGARGLTLGGVPVVLVYRQSSLPLGEDGSNRSERADNYYVQATRPTAWRTD